jgi:hypothetical protein
LKGRWVIFVHWCAISVFPKNDPSCPVLALESEICPYGATTMPLNGASMIAELSGSPDLRASPNR